MDAEFDLSSTPQLDALYHLSPEEEQRFGEWTRKRIGLYRMMDQQIQASVKQIIHFGAEFTKQLEEESERLLLRYRRQRLDQLQLRDTLRQEVSELRATLVEERRIHETDLSESLSKAEHEITQARRQAEIEIAQQQAAAQAERERVLSETRQLSARLTELQRSLSDMLRLAPAPEPRYPGVAQDMPSDASIVAPSLTNLSNIVSAPSAINTSDDEAITTGENEIGTGDPAFAYHQEMTPIDSVEPPEAADPCEYLVLFKNVQSFVVASDLLDQLGQIAEIREARLIEYEQSDLTIALTYEGATPINDLLSNRLSSTIGLAAEQGGQVNLTYHTVA